MTEATVDITTHTGALRTMDDIERDVLRQALRACDGNRLQAALGLRIGRSTLYRKIRRYGL